MKEHLTYRNVLTALLVLLTIVFIAQNAEVVEVTLWFWTVSTPRSVVILLSILIGLIIGFFTGAEWWRKRLQKKSKEILEESME